jgi:hypothetical protein
MAHKEYIELLDYILRAVHRGFCCTALENGKLKKINYIKYKLNNITK